jgi:hypothetical protein
VHHTHQVEDEIVPLRRQGRNPLGHFLFHDTPGAEAGWANIAAGVTAEAALELLGPERPFLGYGFFAELIFGRDRFFHWRDILSGEQGIEDQGFGVLAVEAFVQKGQSLGQLFFLSIEAHPNL